jgi:multicomponent Na+:H+ antiporter subunit G
MTAVSSALLLVGCAFLLLASIGVIRMPDLYIRMSASSKAVTLGVGCLALGLALKMDDAGVSTRAILLVFLFLLKAPVAAHMLGRASYFAGVPLWEGTVTDELKGVELGRDGDAGSDPAAPERRPNERPGTT